MKLIIFLALLIVVNTLAYSKPLHIGVVNFAPPFSSAINLNTGKTANPNKANETHHFYGFCIDLMDEICVRIQETCHYKETELGEKQLNDLRKGTIDVTFLTSPVSSTTDKDYIYSLPYIPSRGQFIVPEGSKINSLDDLVGKKIGTFQASALKNTIVAKYTSLKNIKEYTQLTQMLDALNTHQVDALLINASFAKYLMNNVERLKPIGKPMELGMGYGMIALKHNQALIDQINKALLQIESDGTYTTIYNKYFGV
jgi:ABC-type amino acid transport substrate-binding protein